LSYQAKRRLKLSKQLINKEEQAFKDIEMVRSMRQEVDDHNESLKYDDELADVKKSLDDANAEN
jgi:hypothetical protein